MNSNEQVIEITGLKTELGGHLIHDNLNLTILRGEIFAIVGGSGSGKTTLLREIMLLQQPAEGTIKIFGKDIKKLNDAEMTLLQQRWGVMFQHSALFGSLTLLENVAFPFQQHTQLDKQLINEIALLKISLVGLPANAAAKYPAELSGGMQKRGALARALALDPELLFLDEPTAGLDPQSASALDELVLNLQKTLGLTIVMVTHDLDTLWRATNRIAFLGDGKVKSIGAVSELANNTDPMIHAYFHGPRGRAAGSQSWAQS